jgi:hypothetical protein
MRFAGFRGTLLLLKLGGTNKAKDRQLSFPDSPSGKRASKPAAAEVSIESLMGLNDGEDNAGSHMQGLEGFRRHLEHTGFSSLHFLLAAPACPIKAMLAF